MIETPYYLIDERKILRNLKIIEKIKKETGAKFLLALKCFSTWSVFELLRKYLDGVTTSSLYEIKLGSTKFKKEVHGYSVGFKLNEILEAKKYVTKLIFNSISQLERFYKYVKDLDIGLRINPSISYSNFDLADPAIRCSRLGARKVEVGEATLKKISGVMFHYNCENDDFENYSKSLDYIEEKFADIIKNLKWVSLGGGIYFTKKGYPVKKFIERIKKFKEKFGVEVYFEPGEAVITSTAWLVVKVVDIVKNEKMIAVVDASTEAHMLDLLIYRTPAKLESRGKYSYIIAGRSCLAGDIFGEFRFPRKLKIGDIIKIPDAAGYTMVKKNWFNGLQMPSIVIKRLNGRVEVVRKFNYSDYINSLS